MGLQNLIQQLKKRRQDIELTLVGERDPRLEGLREAAESLRQFKSAKPSPDEADRLNWITGTRG